MNKTDQTLPLTKLRVWLAFAVIVGLVSTAACDRGTQALDPDLLLRADFERTPSGEVPAKDLPGLPSGDAVEIDEGFGSIRASTDRPLSGSKSLRFTTILVGGPDPSMQLNDRKATFKPLPRQTGSTLAIAWRGRVGGTGIGFRILDAEDGRIYMTGSIEDGQVSAQNSGSTDAPGTRPHSVDLRLDTSVGLYSLVVTWGIDGRAEETGELSDVPGTARDVVVELYLFSDRRGLYYDVDDVIIRRVR